MTVSYSIFLYVHSNFFIIIIIILGILKRIFSAHLYLWILLFLWLFILLTFLWIVLDFVVFKLPVCYLLPSVT